MAGHLLRCNLLRVAYLWAVNVLHWLGNEIRVRLFGRKKLDPHIEIELRPALVHPGGEMDDSWAGLSFFTDTVASAGALW